jgi:hypothetical protein
MRHADERERLARGLASNLLRFGHIRQCRFCSAHMQTGNFRLNRAILAVGLPRRGLWPNFLTTLA